MDLKKWTGLSGILIILSWSMPFLASAQDSKVAKIVEIAGNGDLIMSDGTRLRLQGVDLPGTFSCFGDERQRYMTDTLTGKSAQYRIEKKDLMGKALAYVDVQGDVASDLIRSGYGFALLSFKYEKQDSYRRAQEFARDNQRGIWSRCEVDCDPRGCKSESAIFSCGR